MRNLKLAFRTLFRTPFVTAVAILSLALGLGANTAIFTLFDRILLRPLPVDEPDRLVNLAAPGPNYGSTSCNQAGDCESIFSYAMYRDLEREQTAFEDIAAHRLFGVNVSYGGQTMNGEGVLVSGSYFPLLGIAAPLGRLLGEEDDATIGGHFVAVLSHGFWANRLGAPTDVVGRTIIVNGQTLTVVGVAPEGFEGTTLGARPMVFVPISMRAQMEPGWEGFENRRSYWMYVFARLKPGSTIEQVTTAINAVYSPIINEVEAPLQQGMSERVLGEFRSRQITVAEGVRGQSSVHEEARMPLLLLFATTGIVLLIACANIANLLLARGANRGMEMAVRLALGANRGRILGQLLTESVVLALMGGAASLLVARWTMAAIGSILPPEAATALALELRPSVLLFAALLSVGTGVIFGMFPALHSTRPDLVSTIRANSGSILGARGASRFRSTLVVAQIALSMMLLITAGLFLKSMLNVSRVDLGLDAENVVTFGISPELNGYDGERTRILFGRLEEELAAIPGVTGVTTAMVPLLAGSNWGTDVAVEGFERGAEIDSNARLNEVGPGYFRVLDIPVLSGREFTAGDNDGTLKVAVVNQAFAEKFNLGRDAVGKWIGPGGDSLDTQIVGLVQDAKYSEVKGEIPPLFFTPYRQDESLGFINFYVRTSLTPEQLLRAIPPVVARLDANLPVENLKTLPQQIRENIMLDRMISILSAAFAGLATLLAAVGLYGVLAYTVAQRTREIGVRMALGADRARVRGMVLWQVTRMFVGGALIGTIAALGIGRAASSLLFGLVWYDPLAIAAAIGVLAIFALGAGAVPAFRASRVDPMHALRYE
jgi:predicted permease